MPWCDQVSFLQSRLGAGGQRRVESRLLEEDIARAYEKTADYVRSQAAEGRSVRDEARAYLLKGELTAPVCRRAPRFAACGPRQSFAGHADGDERAPLRIVGLGSRVSPHICAAQRPARGAPAEVVAERAR